MNARAAYGASLHPDRLEVKRLAWAFALSIALHAFMWGGYEGAKAIGLWDKLAWIKTATKAFAKTPKQKPPTAESEPPLMFVEVNPVASTAEAPKNAKFYSDKNSQAANPDANADTDIPKISGSQEHVAKTDDVRRNDVNKLQPALPAQPAEETAEPKPAMVMGDLALAKPDTTPRQNSGQAERPRPRTVQEALTRQQLNKIPGQQMKQEGGVRRRLDFASLDAKATPFGAYDYALIGAVSQQWFDSLDNRNYAREASGRVVLRFRLKYDGTVSDMQVMETTVNTIFTYLCQKAVSSPAPYEPWPGDMRRKFGDSREITFAFYY